MEDAELRRYVREAFRYMSPETPHISIEEIAEYAKDKDASPHRQQIEKHLEECDLCRGRLADFEQFLFDSQQPPDRDLTPEWRELQRRIRPHKRAVVLWRWFPPVAAALILALGLIWIGSSWLRPSPARLLAQAYQEQRTSDFRLAGATYAPVRVQRGAGSAFALPGALLEAQAQLAEQLKSRPDNPDLLRFQGEAEMMTRDAAAAVRTLQRSADLNPQDARVLADLGAAYALRGDVERQFGDYSIGLENLSRSLDLHPGVPEVVFNRALVLERMMLLDQAVQEWQNYLKLDSGSEWATEARKHLADLQQKMKSREDRLGQLQDDPAKFLALLSAGESVDAEGYLQIAVMRWLPASKSDNSAMEAVRQLASLLQQKHGDSWLSDVAASTSGPAEQEGLRQLAIAHQANQEGRAPDGLNAARKAEKAFLPAGSRSGILWAQFEQVYGLKLQSEPQKCFARAQQLDQNLKLFSYPWLQARNKIEYSICAMRGGRLNQAASYLVAALHASRAAGFDDTELRAGGMYLEIAANINAPSQVFSQAEEFLRTFWNGAYPALRFYQVVAGFVESAESADQKHVAYFLARSALWAAISSRNRLAEATARATVAVAALAIGEETEARANLALSESFLAQDRHSASAAYRLEPQIAFARVELEHGEVGAGLQRLEALHDDIVSPPTVRIGVQYYSALGEAYRRKGLLTAAIESFRKSIDFGTSRIESLASERERAGALKIIEESYRGLVAATISVPGAVPEQALHIWQEYQVLDALKTPDPVRQSDGIVLYYAELPDGYVGWLVRGTQVTMHRLPVSRQEARLTASRFLRLCSDPASSFESIQHDAQQLYQWMIAPFADQLMQTAQPNKLVIEPDGDLAAIPLQALMAADGTYLGQRFAVLNSTGMMPGPSSQDLLRPDTRILVIANPAVLGESATLFPPLPESVKEAELVRATFPSTAIIEGRQATLSALLDWLPNVEVVHVSGHGYSNGDNGALLLAPKDGEDVDYAALRSIEVSHQDWSRVRLVVLSACATAAGETTGPHNPASLVRALTRAGANRIIASLWNVDSAATLELMRVFYASLARGNSAAQALLTAQQSIRNNAQWRHPYYWAGFQLYGTT